MAFDAVVVDVDGTLWDSYPWYARVLATAASRSPEQYQRRLEDGENFVAMCREVGVTKNGFARLPSNIGPPALYPMVAETLQTFALDHVPLAIVTNLPAWVVTPILESVGFGELFSAQVDASSCRVSKPSPVPMNVAVGKLDLADNARIVYVGDRGIDCRAAKAAGLAFAWAAWGYGDGIPEGTDFVLRQLDDLLNA